MVTVDAKLVKVLRDKTGAKMMTCKEVLIEANGDIDKAEVLLRKKGAIGGGGRSDKETGEGAVASYIHAGGKIGVLVEVGCETDFVARNEEFKGLLKDLCMHIAAAKPLALTRDDIDPELIAKEREIARAQVKGKPEKILDKIVDGKIDKFFSGVVLLDQPFVKEPKTTVGELVKQKAAKIGENLQIRRFIRWELGG